MMKKFLRLLLDMLLEFRNSSDIALENLVLRQPFTIMKRSAERSRLRAQERLFSITLSFLEYLEKVLDE